MAGPKVSIIKRFHCSEMIDQLAIVVYYIVAYSVLIIIMNRCVYLPAQELPDPWQTQPYSSTAFSGNKEYSQIDRQTDR